MINLEINIKQINDKLQKLLKNHLLLQKENEQLNLIVKDLKVQQEKNLLLVTRLEQQVTILKSATGELQETDKKMLEKTINQYLKEIDKCIGLLSE